MTRLLAVFLVMGIGVCASACATVPPPTPSAPAQGAAPAPARHAITPPPDPLTAEEIEQLESGATVVRPMRLPLAGKPYVGGVAYHLVRATPAQVMSALDHSENLIHVFPVTKAAEDLKVVDGRRWVKITQGKAFVTVDYTISVTTEPNRVRFWMDPSYPHDIQDVWGYLRVASYDAERRLIIVGFALDIGPGIVRALFERHIQLGVLTTAGRIARFIEERWIPAGQKVAGDGASATPPPVL